MDALNFLKFWRNTTTTTTTTSSTRDPHLVVETDSESDEEDSFFDLELTVRDSDNKENDTNKSLCSKDGLSNEVDLSTKTTPFPLSPKEPISKRKVLPIEPISKPQSPIALLRSAPSFRILMFRKGKRMPKTEEPTRTEYDTVKDQKKETRVFAVKLNVDDFNYSPALSRDNSTRSFGIGSKVRSQGSDEPKPERFSKEVLQKYLKLIKPLYVKVSKRYTDKGKFSGEGFAASSPSSSPSAASVSSRREKQGTRGVSKQLGKSRSAGTVAGVSSPASRCHDSLKQHDDGIQSAILHCKKSFNSRESSIALSGDGSMKSARNSFEDEGEAEV